MLLFGIMWFARAFNIYTTMNRAARAGALAAAAHNCATCGNTLRNPGRHPGQCGESDSDRVSSRPGPGAELHRDVESTLEPGVALYRKRNGGQPRLSVQLQIERDLMLPAQTCRRSLRDRHDQGAGASSAGGVAVSLAGIFRLRSLSEGDRSSPIGLRDVGEPARGTRALKFWSLPFPFPCCWWWRLEFSISARRLRSSRRWATLRCKGRGLLPTSLRPIFPWPGLAALRPRFARCAMWWRATWSPASLTIAGWER